MTNPPDRRRIIILGSTGSIGRNAIDVVRSLPDAFRVVAVAALHSREECEAQARELGAKAYVGEDAAIRAVAENEAEIVLVATVGLSGLKPTLLALEKGMRVALATKEVLVMAGELVTSTAGRRANAFLPVDSEHNAIYQCLHGESDSSGETIERLILTASGGPFIDTPEDLSAVTPAQALNHPRWKMGPKVSIDSATMMNKGFEILEARWLFGVPVDRIDVVVHPESIVHSLVTFRDGSTLAQLCPPDMRVAIQYALSCAMRHPAPARKRLDLAQIGALTFRKPDEKRFPALGLVREACARGGIAPAVVAAADELAVAGFLAGKIGFTGIVRFAEECLENAPNIACDSVEAVYDAAEWVKGQWKY